ncbi:MAG: hypothetical protein WC973_03695 [Candidatus Dojkabacteria bacterium]
MLPVSIDISDFVQTWSLSIQETELFVNNVLDEVGQRFYEHWYNEAGNSLKQTKREYQRGLYVEKPSPDSIIVGLVGWLPNAIEQGLQPYDMKEGFAKSSKRKLIFRKNGVGWYLTIPFRHGTPGIVAESGIFSGIMPKQVYNVARKVLRNGSSLMDSQLPAEFQIKGIRPEVVNTITNQVFKAYQHKSSIYQGMVKSNKEHHGQYVTFRRVSDQSDPDSWVHSGFTAYNLMGKSLDNFPIDRIISNIKEEFIRNR